MFYLKKEICKTIYFVKLNLNYSKLNRVITKSVVLNLDKKIVFLDNYASL